MIAYKTVLHLHPKVRLFVPARSFDFSWLVDSSVHGPNQHKHRVRPVSSKFLKLVWHVAICWSRTNNQQQLPFPLATAYVPTV